MARRRRPNRFRREPLLPLGPLLLIIFLVIAYLVLKDGVHINLTGPEAAEASTYTARSGMQVAQPPGWVTKEAEGTVTIANNYHALENTDLASGDLSVTILPPYPPSLLQESNATAQDMLLTMASSRYDPGVIGAPVETTINGQRAVRVPLTGPTFEGFGLAVELLGGYVVLAFVDAGPDTLAAHESTALEIVGSIRYSLPSPTATPVS